MASQSAEMTVDALGDPAGGGRHRVPNRVRWTLGIAGALVLAYLVSLLVRKTGSYDTPVDGWGVDALRVHDGQLLHRPLLRGFVADQQPGGASVPPRHGRGLHLVGPRRHRADHRVPRRASIPRCPSVADGFYVGFFPLCFWRSRSLIRRGNRGSLLATSLDGLIAGLGVSALSAAFVVAR